MIRDTFRDTLERDFVPCIQTACKTPRAVKQLINRVRLYAMLLRHWTAGGAASSLVEDRLKGEEGNLVIFGILEKLCPDQLQRALNDPQAEFDLGPNLARF